MNFTPLRRPITARKRATAVAENDRGAGSVGPQAPAPAHVEDRALAVEHGRDDPRVARDPSDRLGREQFPVVEISNAVTATSQRAKIEKRFAPRTGPAPSPPLPNRPLPGPRPLIPSPLSLPLPLSPPVRSPRQHGPLPLSLLLLSRPPPLSPSPPSPPSLSPSPPSPPPPKPLPASPPPLSPPDRLACHNLAHSSARCRRHPAATAHATAAKSIAAQAKSTQALDLPAQRVIANGDRQPAAGCRRDRATRRPPATTRTGHATRRPAAAQPCADRDRRRARESADTADRARRAALPPTPRRENPVSRTLAPSRCSDRYRFCLASFSSRSRLRSQTRPRRPRAPRAPTHVPPARRRCVASTVFAASSERGLASARIAGVKIVGQSSDGDPDDARLLDVELAGEQRGLHRLGLGHLRAQIGDVAACLAPRCAAGLATTPQRLVEPSFRCRPRLGSLGNQTREQHRESSCRAHAPDRRRPAARHRPAPTEPGATPRQPPLRPPPTPHPYPHPRTPVRQQLRKLIYDPKIFRFSSRS